MAKSKVWQLKSYDSSLVAQTADKFNIPTLLAQVLVGRGYVSYDEIDRILNTDEKCFYNPFLLDGMQDAVNKIKTAISQNKIIAIYGDYDVDGITSTYIVYSYLKSCDARVMYYIPDRATEGYGINKAALDALKQQGVELIITVDVGITATEEIHYAKSLGIQTIVTDHHNVKGELPDCVAVINPKRLDNKYPCDFLAGVGVAFKLVYALSDMDKSVRDKYIDIAAIGTVADMVPLKDENRYIVKYGLERLKNTQNIGLKALFDVSGISTQKVSTSQVGFGIAPRLNAAGRLASAKTGVNLLLQESYDDAVIIARELDEGNRMRQDEEQRILGEAIKIINEKKLYENNIIIVASKNWHHGVIGIVSSKITEMYYKPSAVISINGDGTAKASGRSIKGFNLFDALTHTGDLLLKYGGHELAAGFSLMAENIDLFSRKINEYSIPIMTEDVLTPKLSLDGKISISDIDATIIEQLEKLEPCGIGNPSPVFAIDDLTVKSIRILKNDKHAFLNAEKNCMHLDCPAFNLAGSLKKFSYGDKISIAGTLGLNTYKGITNPQFVMKDFKISDKFSLTHSTLKRVFLTVKKYTMYTKCVVKVQKIAQGAGCSVLTVLTSLEVFSELGIVKYRYNEDNGELVISKGINFSKKTSLESSKTFLKYNH